jgi:hypothetical protein
LSQAALWKGLDRALRDLCESLISRQVSASRSELSGPKGPLMIQGGQQAKARVKAT